MGNFKMAFYVILSKSNFTFNVENPETDCIMETILSMKTHFENTVTPGKSGITY